jgi:hypothetical protein
MDDIEKLKDILYKKDITISYENNDQVSEKFNRTGVRSRRIIFNASPRSKSMPKEFNEFCLDANGLVLNAPQWEPISVPPLTNKLSINKGFVKSALKKGLYDVSYIEDGTVLTLYYYRDIGKWCLSSQKGIDVTELIFNTLSYAELLGQVLLKNNIDPQEFYDTLDINYCYTIGLKHPDIHFFLEGQEQYVYKIWFVQMCNVTRYNNNESEIIKESPWEGINGHQQVSLNGKGYYNISELFMNLSNSLGSFHEKRMINYGYLLTAKPGTESEFENNISHQSILLESGLLKYIRQLWYNNKNPLFQTYDLSDKINVVILEVFLKDGLNQMMDLFPQFKDHVNTIIFKEALLVDKVYEKIINPTETAISVSAEYNEDDIIKILADKVTSLINVNTFKNPKQKIRDIIHTFDNYEYYYKYMSF